MALSGGSTPKIMFGEMAKLEIEWKYVWLYWVDERIVPPDHPDSNYRMAMENLILPAGIPIQHLNRIAGERYPEEAVAHYISEIRMDFKLKEGELPKFDLIHRGMGPDAHTASLFPGEPLITAENDPGQDHGENIAAAVWVEKMHQWRITLLPAVLEAARHTVILATGEDKAEALLAVLQGPYQPMMFPAQIAAKEATWFIDEAAGAMLTDALEKSV